MAKSEIVRGPLTPLCVKLGVSGFAALFALLAGCGNQRPPPAGDNSFTASPAGGGSSGGFGDAGSSKPPGCGQKADGSFCDCIDVPLFTDPPNMYFALDRSGSMATDNKWSQVRVVVAQILRGLGPRANFGATVFPGFEQNACALPKQILPVSPGDPPGVDGPTTRALLTETAGDPSGGTPTAEALRGILPYLRTVSGKSFVILATDGGPNCNDTASCSVAQCMPNIEDVPNCPKAGPFNCCEPPEGARESCLDEAPTNSAVAALKAAGIPVYVVGLPGAEIYSAVLDELAVSGGTAGPTSPKYFKIDSTSGDALLATLKKIAAKIVATCTFTLKEAPADPNLVNVYLDEVVLPREPVNGWKIDAGTVTLLGGACDRVMSGDVLDVRIITGCPTVEPR